MKLTNCFYFYKLLLLTITADAGIGKINDKQTDDAAARELLRSILMHRDFGSSKVMFNEWESPNGDLYVVPSISEEEEDTPVFGLGYKFINKDATVVQSADLSNVAEIKEENISAAGFPYFWRKHCDDDDRDEREGVEEGADDDYFPFGSKKFRMLGLNKRLVDLESEGNDDSRVQEANFFNWFDEEDGRDNIQKFGKHFNTDHFSFVGMDSVNSNVIGNDSVDVDDDNDSDYDDDDDDEIDWQDNFEPIRIITSYTTTTVTSTHDITVTDPGAHYPSTEVPQKKVSDLSVIDHKSDQIKVSPTTENVAHTNTLTGTRIPFIFSTPGDKTSLAIPTQDVTTIKVDSTTTKVDCESTSLFNDEVVSTKTALSTLKTLSHSDTPSHETPFIETTVTTTESENWIVPTTWKSYPFSVSEIKTTGLHHYNTSDIESSFAYLKTSSISGNVTTRTRTRNGSIYTRVNGTNSSTIATSQNFGNTQNGYVGSLLGLVFTFISGAILI